MRRELGRKHKVMKAIDVHHHYVPRELIEETKRHGKALGVEVSEVRGSYALSFAGSKPHRLQPPIFDVERHINVMDQGQVGMATLEANTNSLGYSLNGEQGEGWCKLYNDCVNELVKQRPDRFVGMATVPLQDPARAAKVLEHAILNLHFGGALIGTNVNGRYYNIKDFDPFWAKAEALDILVVMHPEHIAGAERMTEYGLNAVCGNPADSTLSLGYMLYSGLFDRFPKLKICALWRRLSALSFGPLRQGVRNRQGGPAGRRDEAAERLFEKSLFRYAGVRHGHARIPESQSRRRAFAARHRLSVHARRLDGGGKNPGAQLLRSGKGADSRRHRPAAIEVIGRDESRPYDDLNDWSLWNV